MSTTSDDEEVGGGDLFQEPADYYQPEKQPTFVTHRMLNGEELHLRLVGHNPLWGHLLWNAGRILAAYLETHSRHLIHNKSVLELGAGAGLPALTCALNGAASVFVTDYPDPELIENLHYNIEHCPLLPDPPRITAKGYLWGAPTTLLNNPSTPTPIPSTSTAPAAAAGPPTYDLLILADLLFNHSEHAALLTTLQQTLARTASAQALVFFTPYRPWLLEKDLAFFDLVRRGGVEAEEEEEEGKTKTSMKMKMTVEKIYEKVMEKVMFEEDPGDELLRRTVFGYSIKWSTEALGQEQE